MMVSFLRTVQFQLAGPASEFVSVLSSVSAILDVDEPGETDLAIALAKVISVDWNPGLLLYSFFYVA